MKHARLSPRSAHIIATHSGLAGLCPLIPVPYVDDLLIHRIARRMNTELFAAHGLTLTDAGARTLTATPSRWLRSAVTSVALLPVKRVLRKVVYVFAIKDCADVAAVLFHDGWLLAHLLERLPRGAKPEDPRYLKRVRKAMLQAYQDVDPAPLRRALVGAFLGAKVGAEYAVQAVQRLRSGAEPAVTESDPMVPRMREAAMGEWQYLDALERSFRRHLGPDAGKHDAPVDHPGA